MDDDRLKAIERTLNEHGETLKGIQNALERVAVQNEQIGQLQRDVSTLWTKYDVLCGPSGEVSAIQRFQAGCPRSQVRWLWCVVVPQGLTTLLVGFAVLKVMW